MAQAAIFSAKQKIERLPQQFRSTFRQETESVYDELCSLDSLLEDFYANLGSKLRFDPLEAEIEDVADKIVDLMESESRPQDDLNYDHDLVFSQKLLNFRQEITSLTERASSWPKNMVEEELELRYSYDANPYAAISPGICRSGINGSELVGLEDELGQLVDWLTRGSDKLRIMLVTGMVGIGKTALVQEAYNYLSVVSHFDTQIMVTIGLDYRPQEFLLVVLRHLNVTVVDGDERLGNHELGMRLYRFLESRRYLIVVDDLWASEHSLVSEFFPKNNTGSRIIFISRLLYMGWRDDTLYVHEKCFLNEEDSWNLLRKTVFARPGESCSFQLEKIGKKIAEKCEGLPLAIIAIGRLLCQVEKTVENWKNVLEDENPLGIGIDDNSPISNSISLSYIMLPRYLKTCFLYLGVFPKSYEILVSEIIRLWCVEGFVKSIGIKGIEGNANMFVVMLILYSVVLVDKYSSAVCNAKTCRIHFVFRSLCISIVQKEKFCHVLSKYAYSFPQGTNHQPRLSIHKNAMLGIKEVRITMESMPSVRSLLCLGPYHPYPLRIHLSFKLLKVMNALGIRFYTFPQEILQLVHLKYLAITCDDEVPKCISKIRNLEVLIVHKHLRIKSTDVAEYLPMEIWYLQRLTHLECMGFDLPHPPTDGTALCDLKTLSGVSGRSCTLRVLRRFRRLCKLAIRIELPENEKEILNYFLGNVVRVLRSLASLNCVVSPINSHVIYQAPEFSSDIQKITLSGCKFSWACMTTISKLRKLEVLKLQCRAFCGPEWEPCEGEFCQLRYLLLEDLDVQVWVAKDGHFPNLKRLIIRHCYKLHCIPTNLGNIKSLEWIEVEDSCPSLTGFTKRIQIYHQQVHEIAPLQVCIRSSWEDDERKMPRQGRLKLTEVLLGKRSTNIIM